MTQEQKQLLLKDLCARLPYNLYIRVEEFDVPENDGRITEGFVGNYLKDNRCNDYDADGILNELADGCINVKPYLRPMESMTKEEERELDNLIAAEMFASQDKDPLFQLTRKALFADFFNKHHIDYRGLIPMGLALEASEGMYKTE